MRDLPVGAGVVLPLMSGASGELRVADADHCVIALSAGQARGQESEFFECV